MNKEIIIINDEPFYRIPNGTSYGYAPIPKEFKPYFEKLQQENQQLKEQNEFLIKRENKLQQIEMMFKNRNVDLEELSNLILDKVV